MDTGHWTTALPLDESTNAYGFIYIITNTISGKKYIGKKQMKTIKKRQPLKGKKNKRHFEAETDWKQYTSSSNDLNADIAKHGKHNFKFEIVRLCNSKFELAYFEAKLQFENDVLFYPNKFYNGIINCRIGKVPHALLEKT